MGIGMEGLGGWVMDGLMGEGSRSAGVDAVDSGDCRPQLRPLGSMGFVWAWLLGAEVRWMGGRRQHNARVP